MLLHLESKRINGNMFLPLFIRESGSDYSEEVEDFDELDHREEGQFWATNDEPVERAESPAYLDSDEERPTPEPVISLFAIGKLCR